MEISFPYTTWRFSTKLRTSCSNGPAVTNEDGTIEWWYEGVLYGTMLEYIDAAGIDDETKSFLFLKYGKDSTSNSMYALSRGRTRSAGPG